MGPLLGGRDAAQVDRAWGGTVGGEHRCRDSGELGGCPEREGGCDGQDEGAGEVHGDVDQVLWAGRDLSKDTERELRERLDLRHADGSCAKDRQLKDTKGFPL